MHSSGERTEQRRCNAADRHRHIHPVQERPLIGCARTYRRRMLSSTAQAGKRVTGRVMLGRWGRPQGKGATSGLATHRRRLSPPSAAMPCRRLALVGFAAQQTRRHTRQLTGLTSSSAAPHPKCRARTGAQRWYKASWMSTVIPRNCAACARQEASLGGPKRRCRAQVDTHGNGGCNFTQSSH